MKSVVQAVEYFTYSGRAQESNDGLDYLFWESEVVAFML